MPKRSLPATGEAISTAKATRPDAKLLRLEAEFNASRDRERQAADKVEELEAEFDRLRKRIHKAEQKLERRTVEADRLMQKIMATRAKSLEGMIAKVRVRKSWSGDDDESERAVLASLVRDLERTAGPTAAD
jgi:chromosome segregation ATPase